MVEDGSGSEVSRRRARNPPDPGSAAGCRTAPSKTWRWLQAQHSGGGRPYLWHVWRLTLSRAAPDRSLVTDSNNSKRSGRGYGCMLNGGLTGRAGAICHLSGAVIS